MQQYLISVDLKAEEPIDQRTCEILKLAVSTVITDNLECEVVGVRIGPYERAAVGSTAKPQSAEYVEGVKQNTPTTQ